MNVTVMLYTDKLSVFGRVIEDFFFFFLNTNTFKIILPTFLAYESVSPSGFNLL